MQWVTDELSAGRLSIGDHLPSERALAETLKVSRGSIREALRVLEALGSIRSSTGSGPRAGTVITAAPEQALSLALNLQLATSQVEHPHVFEMRLLLEDWAVRNAGPEHADPQHPVWMKAEKLLDMMDDPALPVADFLNLDAQFHVALSHAANNPLASTLMVRCGPRSKTTRLSAPKLSPTGRRRPSVCVASIVRSWMPHAMARLTRPRIC